MRVNVRGYEENFDEDFEGQRQHRGGCSVQHFVETIEFHLKVYYLGLRRRNLLLHQLAVAN